MLLFFGGSLDDFSFNVMYIMFMLCESLSPAFTLPDDERFVSAVVRMKSMRDSPCGVRLVGSVINCSSTYRSQMSRRVSPLV